MREVKVSELSGIELEWAFGEATSNRQYVHELDDSLLYLVGLEDVRRTIPQKYEKTKSHQMAAILIERGLNVLHEDSGFRVTGFADFNPYAVEPRTLSAFGESLLEAVSRAVCSYCGDKFAIPDDVARLHDRRSERDRADMEEMLSEGGPTFDELSAMGVFDGKELQ